MGLFGIGRVKPEHVWERGQQARGRIVGITVDETSGSGDTMVRIDDYALEVGAGTPFVAGVRQALEPDDVVRLGMEVRVRYLDDHAVIDWPATVGAAPGLSALLLKQPPPGGIVDHTLGLAKARKKGVAATATVTATSIRDAMLGMAQVLHLDLTVQPDGLEAYDTEVAKVQVPHYATHLAEVGAVLPAWVRPDRLDRVTLDWPAAAMADPGIGRPPAAVLAGIGTIFTSSGPPAGAMTVAPDAGPVGAVRPDAADAVDGVTFDLWVAVEAGLIRDRVAPGDYDAYAQQHGVPAGAWAGAAAGWQQRIMSDWRLGAAYGEAIEAARKGR